MTGEEDPILSTVAPIYDEPNVNLYLTRAETTQTLP